MHERNFTARHQSALWLVALTLLVANCNSNEFGAAGIDKKKGPKKGETSEKGDMLGGSESDGNDEETEADQPVDVTGAFLTCQTDDKLPKASDQEIGFGCNVFEADGKRMNLSEAKFEFSMAKQEVVEPFIKFDKTHPDYHGVSSVNIATVSSYQVLFSADFSTTLSLKSKIDSSFMKRNQE